MINLAHIPRIKLSHLPTPIEKLSRLSAHLNCNIWIKRDDCSGLAGGGNKARKLEFLVADALNKGADTLITTGGIQSNHARQTAAAAAKFGLSCELLLEDVGGTPKTHYYDNGNILLNKLLGATIHHLNDGEPFPRALARLNKSLAAQNKRPYFIPMGGSNAVGSLGYVECANEIMRQSEQLKLQFDHIIVATGSAGTQAGLLAGLMAAKQLTSVTGVCVSRPEHEQNKRVQALLSETLAMLNSSEKADFEQVKTKGDYYGAGYGITTALSLEALHLVAELEGILLDPVYTAKAMAGLIDFCRKGDFSREQTILFLHTGGSQSLFAYQDVL